MNHNRLQSWLAVPFLFLSVRSHADILVEKHQKVVYPSAKYCDPSILLEVEAGEIPGLNAPQLLEHWKQGGTPIDFPPYFKCMPDGRIITRRSTVPKAKEAVAPPPVAPTPTPAPAPEVPSVEEAPFLTQNKEPKEEIPPIHVEKPMTRVSELFKAGVPAKASTLSHSNSIINGVEKQTSGITRVSPVLTKKPQLGLGPVIASGGGAFILPLFGPLEAMAGEPKRETAQEKQLPLLPEENAPEQNETRETASPATPKPEEKKAAPVPVPKQEKKPEKKEEEKSSQKTPSPASPVAKTATNTEGLNLTVPVQEEGGKTTTGKETVTITKKEDVAFPVRREDTEREKEKLAAIQTKPIRGAVRSKKAVANKKVATTPKTKKIAKKQKKSANRVIASAEATPVPVPLSPATPAGPEMVVLLAKDQFFPKRIRVREGQEVRLLFTTVNKRPGALVIDTLQVQRWIPSSEEIQRLLGADAPSLGRRDLDPRKISEVTLKPLAGTYSFHDAVTGAEGEIIVE